MSMAYKINTEIFSIPVEDRYLIYAPLKACAFVADASMVNLLVDLQEGKEPAEPVSGPTIDFLRRLQLFDDNPDPKPKTASSEKPRPTHVSLFLTTACNLRCSYCYASAGDTPVEHMSLDVACRGIDFVLKNALDQGQDSISITYHGGGEPSVNWKVMTGSLHYAKTQASAKGIGVQAGAATNGMLNDKQIRWMVEHLQSASVSFDGLPRMQDKHRITVSGAGSSERVIKTLRCFDAASFSYGIRMTVTGDQIENLPESVEYICRHFKPGRIQIEPAHNMGRWQGKPSAATRRFVEAFRLARNQAEQHGRQITYSAARAGTISQHFCAVTKDLFALTPKGRVSACYEVFSENSPFNETFIYGQIEPAGEISFDMERLNHLRAQTVDKHEHCDGCFAKWNCAGDCYHKSLMHDTAGFSGSERCYITRELTKDQLLRNIAHNGGVTWCLPMLQKSPLNRHRKRWQTTIFRNTEFISQKTGADS